MIPRPPAMKDAVTGRRIGPVPVADRCSAATAALTGRLPKSLPVTPT